MRCSKLAAVAAAALLLGCAAVAADSDYSCPSSCDPKLGCMCASSKAPGGYSNGDTPQFIVLTNDDAVTVISQPIILNITERHKNKNGCKMPATWFVSVDYTDPNLVKQVFARGHEIATHTVSHVASPNATQIVGARDWLVNTAGIPKDKIGGFRAPFLIFDSEQREVLQKNGFWFDSSISEQYPSKTSPSAGERLWPYTMDYGVPQDCAISTGQCDESERHPGLWEFPMWNVQDKTGMTVASMDPMGDPYELYKQQFDERYNGNRAPLGIFIHAAWLIADPIRADGLNKFLEYATSKDNVFLVTVSQVLDWMKNPVSASQYSPSCPSESELLALLPQGTTMCVMPNEGCNYGTFDSSECKCKCQNEEINAAGYCRDPKTGRCTVSKDYDFTNKKYICLQTSSAAAGSSGAAPGPAAAGAGAIPSTSGTQPLTVELDVTGSSPSDFQSKLAQPFCAQLLRLTGDSEATCKVVHVVAATGRRLLQDKTHVMAGIDTKNADATVAALGTDTVYTLLAPAGITVAPGSVKAYLGAPVVPSTDGSAADASGSGSSSSSSTSSGSNAGVIAGAVVGVVVGLGALGGGLWWWRKRKAAKAADESVAARTNSYNPAFDRQAGVTATVSTQKSPTKKQRMQEAAEMLEAGRSPLRDSMILRQSE